MAPHQPIPENENERLLALADLDVDYADFRLLFKDVNKLVAKITGTEISLINLIDSYTQWSISSFGIDIEQMPRDESVCQHTILADSFFEVKNLAEDERFKDKPYVSGPMALKYYLGIPLKTETGQNIGALCVLDKEAKEISAEKRELLEIIAQDVVNRLKYYHTVSNLKKKIESWEVDKKKIAHDIRSPSAGIASVSEVIIENGEKNDPAEVLEFIKLINQSANSLIALADDFFESDDSLASKFNLSDWKSKLERFYKPQAEAKQATLTVNFEQFKAGIPLPKQNLIQISGNLIANALQQINNNGSVQVYLDIKDLVNEKLIFIKVSDNGTAFDENLVKALKHENISGSIENQALALVKKLVENMNGKFTVTSEENIGNTIEVKLLV